MTDLHHFYNTRRNEFATKCEELKGTMRKISLLRIGVAILFLGVIYLGFADSLYWYGTLPLAVIFAFLVSRHGKVQDQYQLKLTLVTLNDYEIAALGNDYSSFNDGQKFSDPNHTYSYDLDLFGKGSLFQFLNRCGTAIGEARLAADLRKPQPVIDSILDRQKAVEELTNKAELRQWFWAQGHLLHDDPHENENLFSWLGEENVLLDKPIFKALLVIFPAISAFLVALTIYDTVYFPLLFVFGGVQWLVISFKSKEVSRAESILFHYRKLLEKYASLLRGIGNEDFSSSRLKDIQLDSAHASERIRKFSQLVNAFESRKNAIASMFGNSLYLYDLQCLYKLEKWRAANHTSVENWLDKVAEVDSLISLATFNFNNPSNCFPEISPDFVISAQDLGHPLISVSERVNNSFNLGISGNIMLVTGANMAGKSTFLRTVGVNLILALSGSSVCAKQFSCPLIKLHTSMRATDSLVDHQSYFYAELSRLKVIMEEVRTGKPIMVLLDEILRGTNSKDKQDGSIGLLKQFVSHKALVMLASHDVVLGELEKKFPESISNHCFESEIDGDVLSFDYTLHKGVAQKANATFLMQKMGILPQTEV